MGGFMFRYDDKVILTSGNIINKEGKIIDYNISFPIKDNDLIIPNDILIMDIFEYHDCFKPYGYVAFKICVGKITSIKEICNSNKKNISFTNKISGHIESVDDKLCYFDDATGNHIVFAKINNGDIVVESIEELKDVLNRISNNFENIENSILKIKNYNEENSEFLENQEFHQKIYKK